MNPTPSFNIEYIVLHVIGVFLQETGFSSATDYGYGTGVITHRDSYTFFDRVSDAIVLISGSITIIGMVLTVILTALIVYFLIRLHTVEHEGFHGKEHVHQESHGEPVVDSANARWERIMELAASASDSDWRRAIVEADIMLGEVLNDRGYVGNTIGDQLKGANPLQFTTLDLAWKAHKVRNDIAHGGESFLLTSRDAQATISMYARVFEEFGIL